MLSLLITGGNLETRVNEALQKQENSPYLLDGRQGSITIEQVRTLQKDLSFTNTNSTTRFAFIIESQNLTVPAQQALLKILEEPPQNTQFVLTSPKQSDLLTTITSRCQIKALPASELSDDYKETKELLGEISKSNHAKLITLADQLSKDQAKLTSLLNLLSLSLHSAPSSKRAKAATLVNKCLQDLNTNTQAQLSIEHMLFQLKALS